MPLHMRLGLMVLLLALHLLGDRMLPTDRMAATLILVALPPITLHPPHTKWTPMLAHRTIMVMVALLQQTGEIVETGMDPHPLTDMNNTPPHTVTQEDMGPHLSTGRDLETETLTTLLLQQVNHTIKEAPPLMTPLLVAQCLLLTTLEHHMTHTTHLPRQQ